MTSKKVEGAILLVFLEECMVSGVLISLLKTFMVLYIYKFFVTLFTVPFSELKLEGLTLDLVD